MNIRDALLPWLTISKLRDELSGLHATAQYLQSLLDEARAQIAKMDGDGDGRIGGSKKKVTK
jgi:hypothetical protein